MNSLQISAKEKIDPGNNCHANKKMIAPEEKSCAIYNCYQKKKKIILNKILYAHVFTTK